MHNEDFLESNNHIHFGILNSSILTYLRDKNKYA